MCIISFSISIAVYRNAKFRLKIQANDCFTNDQITLQYYVSIATFERLLIICFDKWTAYSILTLKVNFKGLEERRLFLIGSQIIKKTFIFPYVNNPCTLKSTYVIQPQFFSSIKRGGGSLEAFWSFRFRGIHTTTSVR